MAITVDASIGGASSNSYLTLARANVLAESLPHASDWLTDGSINKAQLLVHATRLIERHYKPDGSKTSASQSLWWPQTGLYYADTSTAIPSNIIPEFVEWATLEWAWALHQTPDPYADIATGLRELDTPSFNMVFTGERQPVTPRVVAELLGPYTSRRLAVVSPGGADMTTSTSRPSH